MVSFKEGNIWISHRYPQHYFKIKGGFAISKRILDANLDIEYVLIIYHGKRGIKKLKIAVDKIYAMNDVWDNNGDSQYAMPEREMTLVE